MPRGDVDTGRVGEVGTVEHDRRLDPAASDQGGDSPLVSRDRCWSSGWVGQAVFETL